MGAQEIAEPTRRMVGVRVARAASGMSAGALAATIDMSPSRLSRIEHGKEFPNEAELLRLEGALGFRRDWLVNPWLPSAALTAPGTRSPYYVEVVGAAEQERAERGEGGGANREEHPHHSPQEHSPLQVGTISNRHALSRTATSASLAGATSWHSADLDALMPLDPDTGLLDRVVPSLDLDGLRDLNGRRDWDHHRDSFDSFWALLTDLYPDLKPRYGQNSVTWDDPYVGKIQIENAGGGIPKFKMKAWLNGNRQVRGHLAHQRAYGAAPAPPGPFSGCGQGMWPEHAVRARKGLPRVLDQAGHEQWENYVDPRLTTLSPSDLSRLCFALIADRLSYLTRLFAMLAAARYPIWASRIDREVRLRIDEIEFSMNSVVERADLFVLMRGAPAWVAEGLGDLDPASRFPKVRHVDRCFSAIGYGKGTDSEILRFEPKWRRLRGGSTLSYCGHLFDGGVFRREVLALFEPQVHKLRRFRERVAAPLPRHGALLLAELIANTGAFGPPPVVSYLIFHLLERGAVVARSDGDRSVLNMLRRQDIVVPVGRGRDRFFAPGLGLREVVRWVQSADAVVSRAPDTGATTPLDGGVTAPPASEQGAAPLAQHQQGARR